MDRNDFDLSGVEIDLTQFDGVYLDANNFVDLAATTSCDGNATTSGTIHADLSETLVDGDLSQKRKALDSDSHAEVLVVMENVAVLLSEPPSCTEKTPA
ncbi:hypothetical protein FRX31_034990, partial [Thalictrum thalictroides]